MKIMPWLILLLYCGYSNAQICKNNFFQIIWSINEICINSNFHLDVTNLKNKKIIFRNYGKLNSKSDVKIDGSKFSSITLEPSKKFDVHNDDFRLVKCGKFKIGYFKANPVQVGTSSINHIVVFDKKIFLKLLILEKVKINEIFYFPENSLSCKTNTQGQALHKKRSFQKK